MNCSYQSYISNIIGSFGALLSGTEQLTAGIHNHTGGTSTRCEPIYLSINPLKLNTFYIFSWNRDYTFEDVDISQKDINQEKEDEQRRLEELSKELTKAKQRQASIMKTMHDQGDLLLAIAARVGVDIPQDDAENAPRSATL